MLKRKEFWITATALVACCSVVLYVVSGRLFDGSVPENTPDVTESKATTKRERDVSRPSADPTRESVTVPEELVEQFQSLADLPNDHDDRGNLIIRIATRWAESDPEEALAWAASLELTEGALAVRNILPVWVETSPLAAFDYVSSMESLSPELRANSQFVVLNFWAISDFKAAWQAASTLEEGAGIEIRSHLLTENALSDPNSSADALLNLAPSLYGNESYAGTAATVARQLVREATEDGFINAESAKSVIEWAKQLPPGEIRRSAMSGALGEWVMADPEGASTWLRDLPSGLERDAMIEEMSTFTRSPEISFLWAVDAMTDGEARNRVLTRTSISWLESDPEAARKAIDTNADLTDQKRALIYERWEQFAAYRRNGEAPPAVPEGSLESENND